LEILPPLGSFTATTLDRANTTSQSISGLEQYSGSDTWNLKIERELQVIKASG
jgi:hypothetical protein